METNEIRKIRESKCESDKVFIFGESTFKSIGRMDLPVTIMNKRFYLRTEIINGDTPWLLGRKAMSNMDMIIKMKERKVEIRDLDGIEVNLKLDNKGHLRLPVRNINTEELLLEGWLNKGEKERKSMMMKLHLQFGHGSFDKLWDLTESAKWSEGMEDDEKKELKRKMKLMIESCETCKRYKKTPPRPVVGLSLSKTFNEVLSMDVGEIEGRKFLVLVDTATRYCQAVWIKDKKPRTIITALVDRWFSIFGVPAKILSDNGGEFQNEEMRAMTDKWNIKILTTSAQSPWSNGICEKTVGILKSMLLKMKNEKEEDWKMSLKWAVSARNSLMNQGGFAPNQLVFGKNPTIPNLIGEGSSSPASRELGEEDIMREELEALHEAREKFIQSESCNKLSIALNKQVREHKLEDAMVGDEVYYKRDNEQLWRGPAKILGVCGKTVVVKHGDSLREVARVHITRIQSSKDKKEQREENRGKNDVKQEENMNEEKFKEEQECKWIKKEDREEEESEEAEGEESDEEGSEEREESGEEEESEEGEVDDERVEDAGSRESEIPKLKKGQRIRAVNKDSGDTEEWSIISLAGKRSSKKWKHSYNVEDIQSKERGWVNLEEYEKIEEIEDEEEILLGFEDKRV